MVCAPWRSCSDDQRGQSVFDRRYHPRRWVISTVDGRRRRLLNVCTGEFVNLRLPDRRHYFVLGPTAEGLLLRCRKGTLIVQLLNPLTGQVADLPHARTLFDWYYGRRRSTADKLAEVRLLGAGLAGDSTVAVLFRECDKQDHDKSACLAVARPGGKSWIRLDDRSLIISALPFAGRFYCATSTSVLVLQAAASENPRLVVAADYQFDTSGSYICLADNDGTLSLTRCYPIFFGQRHRQREVCRVDLDARRTVAMHGVHGRAMFLGVGHNGGRALSVRGGLSPSIGANTIHFCKYQVGNARPMDFDVWRLTDDSVTKDCRKECNCGIADHLTRYIFGC